MIILQTASDLQMITTVYSLIAKLETDISLSRVAIKLAELTQQILIYDNVPNSDKDVANIIRDLCDRDIEVKNAVVQELNLPLDTITVNDNLLESVFSNLN